MEAFSSNQSCFFPKPHLNSAKNPQPATGTNFKSQTVGLGDQPPSFEAKEFSFFPTEISSTAKPYFHESPRMSENKSLYSSEDKRLNLYEIEQLSDQEKLKKFPDHEKILANAAAVACLMLKTKLVENVPDKAYALHPKTLKLSEYILKERGIPLKETEKFGEEPIPGLGTGFLVRKKTIMTAAHCVCLEDSSELDKDTIENMMVVFNFRMNNKDDCKREFSIKEVYKVKSVKLRRYAKTPSTICSDFADWALLKLDREVEGITPVKIGKGFNVKKLTEIYMIT